MSSSDSTDYTVVKPPAYILKLFIMKESTSSPTSIPVPAPKYDELVKMYEEKVEAHNKKLYDSQYPDSGFDLFTPFDYTDHAYGYTDNR